VGHESNNIIAHSANQTNPNLVCHEGNQRSIIISLSSTDKKTQILWFMKGTEALSLLLLLLIKETQILYIRKATKETLGLGLMPILVMKVTRET